jgi:hypothetical protein
MLGCMSSVSLFLISSMGSWFVSHSLATASRYFAKGSSLDFFVILLVIDIALDETCG